MPVPSAPASTISVLHRRPSGRAAVTPAAGSAYTTTGPSGVAAIPVRAGTSQSVQAGSSATVCTAQASPSGVAAITCWPAVVDTVAAIHGEPFSSNATEGQPGAPPSVDSGAVTCVAVNGSGPLAYQMPSTAAHTTWIVPSSATVMSVPAVVSCFVSARDSTVAGPNGTETRSGGSWYMAAAPRFQIPSDCEASRTPGTNGAPTGRGTGISPSSSSAGKPRYETNGMPSASRATAGAMPTLSIESATSGTNCRPDPKSTAPTVGSPHAAATRTSTIVGRTSRLDTSAGIVASIVKPAAAVRAGPPARR